MIDPREVRPGNRVIKVTGIDTNTKPLYEYKAVLADEYFYSFVKFCFPILLTPAVSGNSGFHHQFGDWYHNEVAEGPDDGLAFYGFVTATSAGISGIPRSLLSPSTYTSCKILFMH